MGPCRLSGKKPDDKVGVCGATLETVVARNFARAIASGCAAHAAHGRSLALALRHASQNNDSFLRIKDEEKLHQVAKDMGIKVGNENAGLTGQSLASEVARKALADFGSQEQNMTLLGRAPQKRQEIWQKLNLVPRGIDREIVETLHQTSIGVNQEKEHILAQALRTSLADGWGSSMLATEISDILFGTPSPRIAQTNLGVLQKDQVNIIVHGHEPVLSEAIVSVISDNNLSELAKSKGAKGINLVGLCCTSNEILMRHGIPSAGNILHQELALLTGAVDAIVVDVQCIFQSLTALAKNLHTKVITTSADAKMTDAIHVEINNLNAQTKAREIVQMAIDNFPRRKQASIPPLTSNLVAGFSKEYIEYMLGGKYRASFKPLNDAIITGCIQGIVAVVGCNNPRVVQDQGHHTIVKELIRNNVLVVQTGCGALANAKYGLLVPEAKHHAGPFLREVCKAIGIPPVLHLGSCVDNSRILTILTAIVNEGGLGEDITDLPVAGVVPEWMSEKALGIGTYFAASGVSVFFGHCSPVEASDAVTDIISSGWEKKLGGKLEFEPDSQKIIRNVLDHIGEKRKALGIFGIGPHDQEPSEIEKRKALRRWQMKLRRSLQQP